jgi:acetyl-CoA C-acetyltransferase
MPSPAAKDTRAPRAGITMRCLPGDVRGALRRPVAAAESVTEGKRIRHSFMAVNFIGYEGHGFAESFGGYSMVEAAVTNVRGTAPVNPARKLEAEGRAPRATDVAQCPQLFPQRRVVAASRIRAARIAMAHTVGGLTVLSAGTILEGPGANGS